MFDLESLLAPLTDDAPCGADLEYDPVFLQLEQAGAGKAEAQFGDTVIPAEPPEWRTVKEHALDLAARTRDLRVAIWLTRCGARLEGLAGAVAGLQLVDGLLSRQWAGVHPQLDASDNDDPTMRISALAPLVAQTAVIADLRAAALVPGRGGLTVRDIELALGLANPLAEENPPTEAGVLEAVNAGMQADAGLTDRMRQVQTLAESIGQTLDAQLPGGSGLDLEPLLRLAKALTGIARRAAGDTSAGEGDATVAGGAAPSSAGGGSGQITSRDDVVRTIERLCDWIERNEPSNPAPLLLRRAQRLMSKSFVDIVRDLAPESLDQIAKLAGVDLSNE